MDMIVRFEGERDRRTGLWNVFVVLETKRCYRVRGEIMLDSHITAPLGIISILYANSPTRVHIEQLNEDQRTPVAQQIVIRAWPPNAELDNVEAWTCPCGAPVEDGDGKVGHWQIERPVHYELPVSPRVTAFG